MPATPPSWLAAIRTQCFSGRVRVWATGEAQMGCKEVGSAKAGVYSGLATSVCLTPCLTETCACGLLLAWEDNLGVFQRLGPCYRFREGYTFPPPLSSLHAVQSPVTPLPVGHAQHLNTGLHGGQEHLSALHDVLSVLSYSPHWHTPQLCT